jgi:hypothetical protein
LVADIADRRRGTPGRPERPGRQRIPRARAPGHQRAAPTAWAAGRPGGRQGRRWRCGRGGRAAGRGRPARSGARHRRKPPAGGSTKAAQHTHQPNRVPSTITCGTRVGGTDAVHSHRLKGGRQPLVTETTDASSPHHRRRRHGGYDPAQRTPQPLPSPAPAGHPPWEPPSQAKSSSAPTSATWPPCPVDDHLPAVAARTDHRSPPVRSTTNGTIVDRLVDLGKETSALTWSRCLSATMASPTPNLTYPPSAVVVGCCEPAGKRVSQRSGPCCAVTVGGDRSRPPPKLRWSWRGDLNPQPADYKDTAARQPCSRPAASRSSGRSIGKVGAAAPRVER